MNIENTLQNEFEKLILSFFLFLQFNHMVGQLVFLTLIIPPLRLLSNPVSCFALIVAHQDITFLHQTHAQSGMTINLGEEDIHWFWGQQKNDRDNW